MQIRSVAEYNVREHGAYGDSVHDDFVALQNALDNGGPLVYVPQGKYRVGGTLRVKSGTRLRVHPEAEIIFGDGAGQTAQSFLLTNYPGAHDIELTGGIWNGNRQANPRVRGATAEQLASGGVYLGIGLSFLDVDGLRLAGLTVRDTEAFHIRLHGVRHFLVEDILFDDLQVSTTQDGVHIGGGCEDGIIRHIRAHGASSPNDDMISLISDLPYENMSPDDPIYGQKFGDIRNIRIYDIKADSTFSFVRLLSLRQTIENIDIEDVAGGHYYLALQLQISPYLRMGKEDNASGVFGTGNLRNVRIANWHVYHRYRYGVAPEDYESTDYSGMIDIEQRLENFVIEDFRRDRSRDTHERVPTLSYKSFTAARVDLDASAGTRLVLPDRELMVASTERYRLELTDADRFALYGDIGRAAITAL